MGRLRWPRGYRVRPRSGCWVVATVWWYSASSVPLTPALAGLATGLPLPAPRYVDVAGVRFTRRVSCCLLYRLPPEPLCTSRPRRPAAERQVLLEDTAARMR